MRDKVDTAAVVRNAESDGAGLLSLRHWLERVDGLLCDSMAQRLAVEHVERPVHSEIDAAIIVLLNSLLQGKALLPHWTNNAGIVGRYSIEFVRHEIFYLN